MHPAHPDCIVPRHVPERHRRIRGVPAVNQRQPRQNAFEHFDRIAAVKERGIRPEPELVVIASREIETEGIESTEDYRSR
jgi:hypothetical protein